VRAAVAWACAISARASLPGAAWNAGAVAPMASVSSVHLDADRA